MSELKRTPKQEEVQKKIPKRVESDNVKPIKRSFWKRVKDALFSEKVSSVGDYILKNVFVPAIKKLIVDSGTNALNMTVYGDARPGSNGRSHVENASYYESNRIGIRATPYYNRSNRFTSLLSDKKFDKETIEAMMDEILAIERSSDSGFVSVTDLALIVPPRASFETTHLDKNWGWYGLNSNCIVSLGKDIDGIDWYMLDLPPAREYRG